MLRRVVFISGALFVSTFIISSLFKLLHLQGAQILLIASMLIGALVFIPTLAAYLYNKGQK